VSEPTSAAETEAEPLEDIVERHTAAAVYASRRQSKTVRPDAFRDRLVFGSANGRIRCPCQQIDAADIHQQIVMAALELDADGRRVATEQEVWQLAAGAFRCCCDKAGWQSPVENAACRWNSRTDACLCGASTGLTYQDTRGRTLQAALLPDCRGGVSSNDSGSGQPIGHLRRDWWAGLAALVDYAVGAKPDGVRADAFRNDRSRVAQLLVGLDVHSDRLREMLGRVEEARGLPKDSLRELRRLTSRPGPKVTDLELSYPGPVERPADMHGYESRWAFCQLARRCDAVICMTHRSWECPSETEDVFSATNNDSVRQFLAEVVQTGAPINGSDGRGNRPAKSGRMEAPQTGLYEATLNLVEHWTGKSPRWTRAAAQAYPSHCPVHDGSLRKAGVFEDSGVLHCFVCDQSWSLLGLVEEMEGLTGAKAVAFVLDITGFELGEQTSSPRPPRRRRPSAFEIGSSLFDSPRWRDRPDSARRAVA
jgi:hypothetical protein